MTRLCLALVTTAALALPAAAKVPLRDEAHINAQLLAAQIGDILRKTCPNAGARLFVVYGKLRALESYARDKGYTEEEVEAYLDSKEDKARIKALANEYLAEAGAVSGDPESYCRVARDEVARGTLTGEMIWVDD